MSSPHEGGLRARIAARSLRPVALAAALVAAPLPLVHPGANASTLLEELENELGRQVDRVSRSLVTVVAHADVGSAPRVPFVAGPFGIFPQNPERHATGCGIVVDSLGYVLTTLTVVQGATRVDVVCPGGTPVPATVVGFDPLTDIALLRAEQAPSGGRWEPVPAGDAGRMTPGAWVTVLGNAFGIGPSVATGVVSRRAVVSSRTGERLMQMNVRAGPGDMGGAVMDSRGNVVGMVCAILADPRDLPGAKEAAEARDVSSGRGSGAVRRAYFSGDTGISFAMPLQNALKIARHLRENGRLERGFLGVEIRDALVEAPGADVVQDGAYVARVLEGGPAYSAGVRPGDVIVEADGARLASADALRRRVMDSAPGTRISIVVRREDDRVPLEVVVGRQPATLPPATRDEAAAAGAAAAPEGAATQPAALQAAPARGNIEARIQELEAELGRLREELDRTRREAAEPGAPPPN